MYYRSTITGKILHSVHQINDIYGEKEVDRLINNGTIQTIEEPSIEEIIKYGTETATIVRYREIHNCTLREARDAVKELIKQYQEKEG